MHPWIGAETPERCSECGMQLVERAASWIATERSTTVRSERCAQSRSARSLRRVRFRAARRGLRRGGGAREGARRLELVWRRGGAEDAALDARARAARADELTEDEAVAFALLSNRRLQALYAELGFAQADVLAAARLPNPSSTRSSASPTAAGRARSTSGSNRASSCSC
jgi:hypothetical protein